MRRRRRPRCAGPRRSSAGAGRRPASMPGRAADVGLQPLGPRPDGLAGRIVPQPAILAVAGRRPAGSAGATRRTGRPSTRGAGRRACRRRPRSAPRGWRTPPSVGTPRRPAAGSPGGPRRREPAQGGRAGSARRPSPRRGGGRGPGRPRGGPCRRRGAGPRPRRAAGPRRSPRASIRAARKAATSATARACRTNQAGGSRESRREAASTRPGTVIEPMVADARRLARAGRRRGAIGVGGARARGRGP